MIAFVSMPLASLLAIALHAATGAHVGPSPARPRSNPAVKKATPAAAVEPSAAAYDDATAVFAFADGAVYHVYTAPERVTDIILQPGEQLGSVAAGDTARWVIGDTSSGSGKERRAHVLIKPVSPGLVTNLVVTTDRRTYHLLVTSTPRGAISALSWRYPQDALIAFRQAATDVEAPRAMTAGVDPSQLRFDYAITGDHPAWRPLRVFDDGRQTYLEFPASIAVGEAPPLFLIGDDGKAELVNYRVRGRFYVVDRLFDTAELRLGAKHQQVVRITRSNPDHHPRKGR